jgi:hypothetical protein
MSAEIISLHAWRREHREHREPETTSVSVPFLLPTWPCGWLQPVLVEVDLGLISEFCGLVGNFADQAGSGGLPCRETSPRPDWGQERPKSAAIHRLFQAPSVKGKVAGDL